MRSFETLRGDRLYFLNHSRNAVILWLISATITTLEHKHNDWWFAQSQENLPLEPGVIRWKPVWEVLWTVLVSGWWPGAGAMAVLLYLQLRCLISNVLKQVPGQNRKKKIPERLVDYCKHSSVNRMAAGPRLPRSSHGIFLRSSTFQTYFVKLN